MKKGFYILLCLFFVTATSSVSFATVAEPKAYGIENVNLHPPSLAVNIDNFITSTIENYSPVVPAQTHIACDKAITDTPVKGPVVEVNKALIASSVTQGDVYYLEVTATDNYKLPIFRQVYIEPTAPVPLV